MCEVNSCCGCICLYKASIIIGFVTILASMAQSSVFSLILMESYDSSNRTVANNSSEDNEDSIYSFTSKDSLCPFGYMPLVTVVNGSIEKPPETTIMPEFEVNITSNGDVSEKNLTPISTVACLAPPQGVLWAFLIVSIMYAPIGLVLIVGVVKGISCLLSTWFFYTVGYNLLALIIALTDGVYTGAGDISSYVLCLILAYCIIIVDSYYEKLLRQQKAETAAKDEQQPPSIAVPQPSDSPDSSVNFPSPTKIATPQHDYNSTCEASELLLPSKESHKEMSPA